MKDTITSTAFLAVPQLVSDLMLTYLPLLMLFALVPFALHHLSRQSRANTAAEPSIIARTQGWMVPLLVAAEFAALGGHFLLSSMWECARAAQVRIAHSEYCLVTC